MEARHPYPSDRPAVNVLRNTDFWIGAAIVTLALVLRLLWLNLKPAHFDEGVNGWFVDQMTKQGFFHYDPTNFHGPLHFYVLFVFQTLFGRDPWVLRLPIALLSTGCVAMVLAFRHHFDRHVCQIAALAMAVSPAMVFYGRYAIHETWMLFFLLLLAWGLAGLWRHGQRRYLWASAMGITGMILTKETYIIHFVAFLLAAPCLLGYEQISRSHPYPWSGWHFSRRDVLTIIGVSFALILFFYTGGFLDWSALPGLWETFTTWIGTGTKHESGHEKAWWYWFDLLSRYEWTTLVGFAAGLVLLKPGTSRVARYLAIAGVGTWIGYSIVPYKTPWCVIVLIWPFYFLFGLAVVRLARHVDRWVTGALTVILLICTLTITWKLNFKNYDDEQEPYVYVQSSREVNLLLEPLRKLALRDARNYQLRGHLILPEQYPWVWTLGDFPHVDYPKFDELPEPLDAEFLVIDNPLVDQTEPLLRLEYFKLPMHIRGMSDTAATLYLFVDTFAGLVPADTPRFIPGKTKPAEPEEDQ